MAKCNDIKWQFFFIIILILSFFSINVDAYPIVNGTIVDELGVPISGAQVTVWYGLSPVGLTYTDINGGFSFDIEKKPAYTLIVYCDRNETLGLDYLPSFYNYSQMDGNTIHLSNAASIDFFGDILFVESDELPSNTKFTLIDPDTNDPLLLNGRVWEFGKTSNFKTFFDLTENKLFVPLNTSYQIKIDSNIIVGTSVIKKEIIIEEPFFPELEKGDKISLNLKPYVLSNNQELTFNLVQKANTTIQHMASLGFYLVVESRSMESASNWLSESIERLNEGIYVESYDLCKRSYLELINNIEHLNLMLSDAAYSVYIIISFLSLASIAVAFLLTNNNTTKVITGTLLYSGALIILYYTYPGSTVIPLTEFLGLGAISIFMALFFATYVPRFMKGREKRGIVPLRNILVPIFSISKRSIKRRRLRFLLTLISISLLILSFVSMTSVSEGYGVGTVRISNPIDDKGVLLRAIDYDEIDLVSLSERDLTSDWLEIQNESKLVSPKVENKPQSYPLGNIQGQPIWGFLGISTETENEITKIGRALIKGGLPSDGGVVLSNKLSENLGLDVGGSIIYNGFSFQIEGIFNDDILEHLEEFDGSKYLPGKLVDLFPEDRVVYYIKETCSPSEVLYFNLDTALNLFKGIISRISIIVNEEYDLNVFAERLALERGFLAYSSTSEGIYLMKLGKYLEGKGIQLLIPWGIVILNVVVTMLNSMFERKKEIQILSSLGLNPSQIATIFFAEASIIGLTAGGIGYLAGISLYKVLPSIGITLGVQQKISASWSLASVSISIMSVLAGAFAALQGSVVITPSLTRKWRIDSEEGGYLTPWEFTIPVKLISEEVDPFIDYMISKLNELKDSPDVSTSYIRVPYRSENKITVTFAHRGPSNTAGSFYTKNSLIVEKTTDEITVKLQSYGERAWVHQTGTLVRMIAMRWSTSSERINQHNV